MNNDASTEQTEVVESADVAPELTEDQQIIQFMKEHSSPKVLERLETEEGRKLAVSFIRANLAEAGGKVEVAAGWFDQSISD